jgi:Flp pilus assembly pilin Flp
MARLTRLRHHCARHQKRRGALTLEWVLLVTLLVIGIIGGLSAVRNATNAELTDLAEAIEAINVSPEGSFRTDIEDDDHNN